MSAVRFPSRVDRTGQLITDRSAACVLSGSELCGFDPESSSVPTQVPRVPSEVPELCQDRPGQLVVGQIQPLEAVRFPSSCGDRPRQLIPIQNQALELCQFPDWVGIVPVN